MANSFPKRWTESFQMRVSPQWREVLARVAAARDVTPSEAVRALVEEADAARLNAVREGERSE